MNRRGFFGLLAAPILAPKAARAALAKMAADPAYEVTVESYGQLVCDRPGMARGPVGLEAWMPRPGNAFFGLDRYAEPKGEAWIVPVVYE